MKIPPPREAAWAIAQRTAAADVLDKMKFDDHPIWDDKDSIREVLAFLVPNLETMVSILGEFESDIQRVGVDNVYHQTCVGLDLAEEPGWPDLAYTYHRAHNFFERELKVPMS